MRNSEKGAFRFCKYSAGIFPVLTIVMASGCQSFDATSTNSIVTKSAAYPLGAASQPAQDAFLVRSLRSDQPLVMTSTTAAEGAYPLVPPQPVKTPAARPVNVAFNLSDDGSQLGGSPYVCSPSGFGRQASCRARF